MARPRSINSSQNALVKLVLSLRDARHRRKQGLVLIDDDRNISRAIKAGWKLQTYLIPGDTPSGSEQEFHDDVMSFLHAEGSSTDFVTVPKDLFAKMSYGQSGHAIAIAEPQEHDLESLTQLSERAKSTVLVLDRTEKPGNIGAAIRTCDALGIDAIILSEPVCDLWNPNAIRASSGAIFSQPIVQGSLGEVQRLLADLRFSMFAARLEDSQDYLDVRYPDKVAVVFGNEAKGLGDRYSELDGISIRMHGIGDSLNVSVSAAIVMSEICRQHRL